MEQAVPEWDRSLIYKDGKSVGEEPEDLTLRLSRLTD
jgi:hypothetical protein